MSSGADVHFPCSRLETRWLVRFAWSLSVAHCIVPEFSADEFQNAKGVGPFFMISAALFEEIGGFGERVRIAGDFDWAARAVDTGEFTRSEVVGGVRFQSGAGPSEGGEPRVAAEGNTVRLKYGRYASLAEAPSCLMRRFRDPGLLGSVERGFVGRRVPPEDMS